MSASASLWDILPTWIEMLLLGAAVLLPAVFALRRASSIRDSRSATMALHRSQLRELEHDRGDGLIAASEHQGARLEIQRRLLGAAALPDTAADPVTRLRGRTLLLLAPVPLAAIVLYAVGGHPGLPAQPVAERLAQADTRAREDDQLIITLRQGLATLDPATPQARQGFILLGQAEATRGGWGAAAAAWRVALDHGFDPTLAAQAAEAQSRADGAVSPSSAALFRRALDAAPADAPWRQLAEQRVAQSEHH